MGLCFRTVNKIAAVEDESVGYCGLIFQENVIFGKIA